MAGNDVDELSEVRNSFYIGDFPQYINEGQTQMYVRLSLDYQFS